MRASGSYQNLKIQLITGGSGHFCFRRESDDKPHFPLCLRARRVGGPTQDEREFHEIEGRRQPGGHRVVISSCLWVAEESGGREDVRTRPIDSNLQPAPIGFATIRVGRTGQIVGGEVLQGRSANNRNGSGPWISRPPVMSATTCMACNI